MIALRKFAIFCHRWMGVAFCLLFTWWFVSGMFMMYWDFPAVRDADRLAHSQSLDASRIRISPEQAYKALGSDFAPDQVRLAMFDGRPAYSFGAIPNQVIVYADDGKVQESYPPELNLRTAAAWTGLPPGEAKVEEIGEADQWTVAGAWRDALPLVKYSWPDGQQVYVGPTSGQVMQYTTRASRLGAWLGPIPHWLYFTPLRINDSLWSRIVIWLSGIGTLMAISGLVVGVLVYSPSKRYRYGGHPVGIPYSGTTCLGPVHGTEVLRRPQPQAAPVPTPTPPPPTPAPQPPPGPTGPTDGIDLRPAIITGGSPGDVAYWPITTKIDAMDFGIKAFFTYFLRNGTSDR